MSRARYEIDADITRAATLPGSFYADEGAYAALRESLFVPSWQLVGLDSELANPGDVRPFTLLEGLLDEPLLLARGEDAQLRCLSNVCTHRGNLLLTEPVSRRSIACGYHGRRFALDGRMLASPCFEDAREFPSSADDLPALPLDAIGPLLFTSLAPAQPLGALRESLVRRLGPIVQRPLRLAAARSRDYAFDASWVLYCENYAEGFHIPFVHPGLNAVLDFEAYTTELFDGWSLQVGVAKDGEAAFAPDAAGPDAGRRVAGYYAHVFPNLLLNFYPWGLSINLVEPLGVARTRARFLTCVADEALLDRGAGAGLHAVELEDEAVVQSVQRGVRARLYRRGRYAPRREQGVHHFHRALCAALEAGRS